MVPLNSMMTVDRPALRGERIQRGGIKRRTRISMALNGRDNLFARVPAEKPGPRSVHFRECRFPNTQKPDYSVEFEMQTAKHAKHAKSSAFRAFAYFAVIKTQGQIRNLKFAGRGGRAGVGDVQGPGRSKRIVERSRLRVKSWSLIVGGERMMNKHGLVMGGALGFAAAVAVCVAIEVFWVPTAATPPPQIRPHKDRGAADPESDLWPACIHEASHTVAALARGNRVQFTRLTS
ncbi:MAG TPA: hypothetical protein VJ302_21585, partial [Blastocatellia bacterium]|nr:hypothetical protein [Blastocatellia bacterium]